MSSLGTTLAYIQQQMFKYGYPIYLILGVTGCCLNIILLTRRQFRKVSSCMYFIMVSITALFALLVGTIPSIYSVDHPNPHTTISAFCKARAYLLQSSFMMYRWYLVAASFDQCALTSTNARLRNFSNIRVAYRAIPIIMIIWFILPVHILVLFDVKNSRCAGINVFAAFYHSIFTIVLGCVLPVSILTISALIIRHNLNLKRQRRFQLTTAQQNNNEDIQRKRDRQIFKMFLIQVIVYVVTQTPFMCFFFYTAATIYVTNKSADRAAIEGFVNFLAEYMLYLFPVLSFYLSTLPSRTFRDELMKLLRCRCRRRRVGDVQHINASMTNGSVKVNAKPTQAIAYSSAKANKNEEIVTEIND